MSELLTEGWVQFWRIICKEGFIDRWIGDMGNNPNLPTKNQWGLNAFVTYYRLNGTGEWIEKGCFNKIQAEMLDNMDVCSAQEIWNKTIIK
jgi:hypothetical protein